MNSKYYKYCIVPKCESTSIKTPNKLFIYVPNKKEIRKKWLTLARRDAVHTLSTDSRMYFCEDHFDLPNDMVNYTEYHVMGKVSQIRMKPNCIPTKFACQPDRRKRTCPGTERPYFIKKQRMITINECLYKPVEDPVQICTQSTMTWSIDTSDTISDRANVQEVADRANVQEVADRANVQEVASAQKANKSVQACVTRKFRSKVVQAKVKSMDTASSPLKPQLTSSFTSPFKPKTIVKLSRSVSGLSKVKRNNILIEEDQSDTNSRSPSVNSLQVSLQVKSSSDCSELIAEDKKIEANEIILNTIKKNEKKTRFYIGIPKGCYFLIDLIIEELHIPKHYLLFCLNKIRLNSTFNQLSDEYGMTSSYLSKIFFKNIPLIASIMRPFIVELDSEMIKRTLPIAFRHKYNDVCCIIDCLEIEIQKPSKAVHQAITWSDYKKANTIKYLVSCTPNGLVNYISPGFAGRTTDTCLVETCDFVKTLKTGACIMADRGFKHVEQYLRKSGVSMVRPPSVETGVKMSKSEAKLTKQIASLRIHVERVIRRLREFYMLKPHACINFKFLKIIDDILIIACGLINLQDSLIK